MWPFSSKKTTETVAKQACSPNMMMILLLSMNQLLEECKQKCEMGLAVLPEDARQTLKHLESIGLGNTQNAKVIREQIRQYEASKEDIKKAKKPYRVREMGQGEIRRCYILGVQREI